MASTDIGIDLGKYQLGWADEEDYVFKPKKGLNEDILREMSWLKGEPDWMLNFRLKSGCYATMMMRELFRKRCGGWGQGELNDDDGGIDEEGEASESVHKRIKIKDDAHD